VYKRQGLQRGPRPGGRAAALARRAALPPARLLSRAAGVAPIASTEPPHGGMGMGLERLTMQMLDLASIKEACLFPRDRSRLTP